MIGGFVVGWVALFNDGRKGWLKDREVMQWIVRVSSWWRRPCSWPRRNIEATEPARLLNSMPGVRHALVKWNIVASPIRTSSPSTATFTALSASPRWAKTKAGHSLYNGRIWHGFQFSDPETQLEAHDLLRRRHRRGDLRDGASQAQGRRGAEDRRDWPGHRLDGRPRQGGRPVCGSTTSTPKS